LFAELAELSRWSSRRLLAAFHTFSNAPWPDLAAMTMGCFCPAANSVTGGVANKIKYLKRQRFGPSKF
jgi:hypothetical protein